MWGGEIRGLGGGDIPGETLGLCDHNCVMLQINRARLNINYSMRKVFLERAAVELVYKLEKWFHYRASKLIP